jgi:hypothetical protein
VESSNSFQYIKNIGELLFLTSSGFIISLRTVHVVFEAFFSPSSRLSPLWNLHTPASDDSLTTPNYQFAD